MNRRLFVLITTFTDFKTFQLNFLHLRSTDILAPFGISKHLSLAWIHWRIQAGGNTPTTSSKPIRWVIFYSNDYFSWLLVELNQFCIVELTLQSNLCSSYLIGQPTYTFKSKTMESAESPWTLQCQCFLKKNNWFSCVEHFNMRFRHGDILSESRRMLL